MDLLTNTKIEALNPYFGAKLSGIDLKEIDATSAEAIKNLLYQKKVLVFKDQELTELEYIAFAKKLGQPVQFVDADYRHPDFPEIFVVSNVKRNGRNFGKNRVGYYWHSDSSFLASPLPVTMLYSQVVPEDGGETGFIDMEQVYKTFPESLRHAIQGKVARHEGKWRYLITEEDTGLSIQELLDRDEEQCPTPVHPLVVTHPKTQVKSFYASEGITNRIVDLSESESKATLDECFGLIRTNPSIFKHSWTKGEIVMWDNRSVVHRGFPPASGQSRLMYRIGLNDGPFFEG